MAAPLKQDPSNYDENQHVGENLEVLFRCWMELGKIEEQTKVEDQVYRHLSMALKKYLRREYEKQTIMKTYK